MSFVDPSQDPLARLETQARMGAPARQTAQPRPPQVRLPIQQIAKPAPTIAPVPRTLFDVVSQMLFGAPEFNQAIDNRQAAGLAEADRSIASMKANNEAARQRLGKMKLGAEALDAGPPVAAQRPPDPLDLFGGPTPKPAKPGAPSPQDFMQQHNLKTPAKQVARPQGPAPTPAMQPQQGPGLKFSPPGAPPPATAPLPQGDNPRDRWAQGMGNIASALGGSAYAEAQPIQQRPSVGPIGNYVDPLKGILGMPAQGPRRLG